ncbi:MAG: LysM peptidoglycan-binding domain-containing protein [Thermodesulfobacteriota bacterium]
MLSAKSTLVAPLALLLLSGCLTTNNSPQPPAAQIEIIEIPEVAGSLEETSIPEPDITVSEEVKRLAELGNWEEGDEVAGPKDMAVTYDFPVTMNKQVEFYLDFFQNRQATSFRRWLERSGRYLPMIQERLAAAGLPLDLAYLPMIESGYSLTAYSRARAAGPWQFIRSTGKIYGLKVNKYEDERRDPVKSTMAAIAFLTDLYDEFDDWHLAVAAYNAGGGKIRSGLRRHKVDNFWDLAQERHLHDETKLYVPKLIAAIMIAKEPEKYGFHDIDYQAPLAYEETTAPRWTSLEAIAVASGEPLDTIQNLNRQLRQKITPPSKAAYPIKVPPGKAELVASNLKKVYPVVDTGWKSHKVARNDTLGKICRRYNLQKLTLLKANKIDNGKLRRGQRLRIPYQTTTYVLWDKEGKPPIAATGTEMILHKIRSGETISHIARRYQVPRKMIVAWNRLPSMHSIRAGQQLAIYLNETPAAATVAKAAPIVTGDGMVLHKIKRGETISQIAKRYHVSKKELAAWNDLNSRYTIRAGQELAVYANEAGSQADQGKSTGKPFNYQVKKGDSLWSISRRFNLSTEEIKEWNNMRGNSLRPGQQLAIHQAKASLSPAAESAPVKNSMITHRVKRGETISHIARRYQVTKEKIVAWNDLNRKFTIRAGQELTIYPEESPTATQSASLQKGGGEPFYYKVQSGDSLWTISRRFNLTTKQIRNWNNMTGDFLRPGAKLLIRTATM